MTTQPIILGAIGNGQDRWRYIISFPFIWSVIIPLAIFDAWITFYQQICFRLYRIPLVNRADYVVMGRYKLAYLSTPEKAYCWYCEYANGVINYARRIAGDTEQMWCPIKHALKKQQQPQPHQADFAPEGDAQALQAFVERNHPRYQEQPRQSPYQKQEA